MIKILLATLLTIILMAYGFYAYTSGNSSDKPGTPQLSSPSEAIEGAKNAVQQSQGLQDKINSKAQTQLDQ